MAKRIVSWTQGTTTHRFAAEAVIGISTFENSVVVHMSSGREIAIWPSEKRTTEQIYWSLWDQWAGN